MNNQALYIEAFSGISGDMLVASLLDLGVDASCIERACNNLKENGVTGFDINIGRVIKSGINTLDFGVILEEDNYDHDMNYLYGHLEQHEHHSHNEHHEHHEHHLHRNLEDVFSIIEKAELKIGAKDIAKRIFGILAEAEAFVHGKAIDEVHFHEVGAIDSIVDIISIAICLDELGVKEVIVPVLYEGRGTIRCQHGILPIPVPAVARIASQEGLKLHLTNIEGELITPTGAAAVAAIKTKDVLPESYEIEKIGLGAGKRQYECPGFLRTMLIKH